VPNKSLEDFKSENPQLVGEAQFAWRLRVERLYKEYLDAQSKSTELQYQQFVPDVDPNFGELTDDQKKFNSALDGITIFDAYNRWAGPSKGYVSQRDNKPVRCPNPDHEDIHPSCWMVGNKDGSTRGAGNCAKCGGFDKFGIAAWYMGYQPSDCRTAQFAEIAVGFGEAFGVQQVKSITGETITVLPQAPAPAGAEQAENTANTENSDGADSGISYIGDGAVSAVMQEEAEEERSVAPQNTIAIPWRQIVPENTFLHAYLTACSGDDLPEEYHFWNGMLALGLAVGRNRMLKDIFPVKANLFVCLIGESGAGKSRSLYHLEAVLREALPYDKKDDPPIGAAIIRGSQSGEALIRAFRHEVLDPVTNKPVARGNVRGLIKFAEFAELAKKASRLGGSLDYTLTDLYDAPAVVKDDGVTRGDIEATDTFPSAISTTQYASIRTLVSQNDQTSGFANRWVFATGIEKPRQVVSEYMPDFRDAVSKLRAIQVGALGFEMVTWEPAAVKVWREYVTGFLIPWMRNQESDNLLKRLEVLLMKLFLLFAINDKSLVVTETHVNTALSLFPYLTEAYERVEKEAAATDDSELVKKILSLVRKLAAKGPQHATARNIGQSINRKYCTTDQLRKTLSNMVQLGYLDELALPAGPKGGRPSKVFKIATGA